MTKTALMTGLAGSLGVHQAQFLIEKGYQVHALRPPSSSSQQGPVAAMLNDWQRGGQLVCHVGDLSDGMNVLRIVQRTQPAEIYHLELAQADRIASECAEASATLQTLGPLRFLEALRILGLKDRCGFYQAMSGEELKTPAMNSLSEIPSLLPRTPCGVAMAYAYWIVRNYRESFGIRACTGFVDEEESQLDTEPLATTIITGLARIQRGQEHCLSVRNLDAQYDWAYAHKVTELPWRMLQRDLPDDLEILAGRFHSVREFVEMAASHFQIPIEWQGNGSQEQGVNARSRRPIVVIQPEAFHASSITPRRAELATVPATSEARSPRSFADLVAERIEVRLARVEQ